MPSLTSQNYHVDTDTDTDVRPHRQSLASQFNNRDRMLLHAPVKPKAGHWGLGFRRSCREGVCGSGARNINGKNRPAYLARARRLPGTIGLGSMPMLLMTLAPILDTTQFFKQDHPMKLFATDMAPPPEKKRPQSPSRALGRATEMTCLRTV